MPKSFLLCLFLALSLFSWGQNQKVTFTLSLSEENCAGIKKKMFLSIETNGQDSLLRETTFSACTMEVEFPRVNGRYHLIIESEKYEDLNLAFVIKDESPALLDLKTFELKKQTKQLEEVTVSGIKRSFIQVDADKTTITVKDNAILTTSSLYDAIMKIPGVVPYPGGGFAIGGKNASIYFEGIPSNLSGDDLLNLLKSLPAASVEKIEIISNPGASYDANVSGAIINVISLSKTNKWLSGTVTLNYGLNANQKVLPSLVMSGRNKKYNWQFQTGYSYFERNNHNTSDKEFPSFSPVARLISDRKEKSINGFFYFKPSFNYKLNARSNVSLSYNGSLSNGNKNGTAVSSSQEIVPSVNLQNQYGAKSDGLNNELTFKYQNKFDTLKRVLSVTAYYSDYSQKQLTKTTQRLNDVNEYNLLKYNLRLKRFYVRSDIEIPFEKKQFYLQGGIKYSTLFANSTGKYNLQNPSDMIFQDPSYNSAIDFDYQEGNLAAYGEMKKGFGKKLSLGAGLRVENFNLDRKSTVTTERKNNYFNLFPSFNGIYRFTNDINLIATYSRKIAIPSYNQFDPNNSGYYDSYNSETGNVLLSPNFFDNMEMKVTVFDYLQLSVNYSHSQTLNLFEMAVQPNSLQTVQTFKTYHNVNSLSYFFSLPVPFGIFKDGLNFFNKSIDIDKINFLYLYAERTKTTVSDLNYLSANKARWTYGVYSQFILPWKIKMNVDYYISLKGMYQIYNITKPRTALEVVLSREFLNKKLRASVSFDDIFNTSQTNLRTSFPNVNMNHYNKDDTRIIWFKLSWSFGQYEKPGAEPDMKMPGSSGGGMK